ncbi:c-type cytochrome biogenesis protein CcsB [Salicibibacter halophilus]|uniref:C-type cytochrome biogenesis protein CcsB n=1 Tax=Salicibibacter halophilus TaxID=2502791 RepID=A0A514LEC0_9BACI|nr:c-type cytochrome biogenesis protein CcsB [Salicibibacter halophilus]QDI89915.1 c-type cytochrome biogenesis protein CcsB [Salicibibacter halophilus]
MEQLSMNLLGTAFFLFLAATIFYAVSVTGRKWRDKEGRMTGNNWGKLGYLSSILGVAAALGYFFTRWAYAGFAPVSNMFEYTAFFAITLSLAFVILYGIYRVNVLGLITMPIVMLMIAYASVFSTDVEPLQPSLQSHWLEIHVITTAIGQGILAVSFGAGLIYLLRTIDLKRKGMTKRTFGVEFIMYTLISVLAFVLVTNIFGAFDYEANFAYINEEGEPAEKLYELPPLFGPNEGELLTEERMQPWFEMPDWIVSDDLNTVVWAFGTGLILYGLVRLFTRRRVGALLQPLFKSVKPHTVDEISYRAIAIGFPVFALGGLIFAMIYAQIAWTRFWGWDPKEVWALVTFLFYAAYLHLRLNRSWHGEPSAWLAVIGFAIIIFNLIFVNLVIAGLHSYA